MADEIEKGRAVRQRLSETLKYKDELLEQIEILKAQNKKIKEHYASWTPPYNGAKEEAKKKDVDTSNSKDQIQHLEQRVLYLETANANLIDDKDLLQQEMRLAFDWEPEALRLRKELEKKQMNIGFLQNQVELLRRA